MLGRELTKHRQGAHEAPTAIAIWPGSDGGRRSPISMALVDAGLRAVSIEDDFEAVLVLDAERVLDLVVELRSGGFRGVIAAALPEVSGRFERILRTAGVNVAERTIDAALAHVVRVQSRNPESFRGIPFELDESSRRVQLGVIDAVLSEAQYRILAVLGREPRRWWKAKALVASAFATNHSDDSSLVRVHMNGIRKQLGIARWCLQSERTFGYRLVTSADELMWIGSRRLWSNGYPGGRGGRESGSYPVSK